MSFLKDFVEGQFFSADSRTYWNPWHFGLKGEPFSCQSASGAVIDALVLPAQKDQKYCAPKGTVFYFHSAQFNLQYNLMQVAYLAHEGFTVVLFDYGGCGRSTGRSSVRSMVDDAEAVYEWMQNEGGEWCTPQNLALFAQGVGCDAALGFLNRHQDSVRGLVLESAYATRKGWIRDRFGPIVGDFLAKQVEEADPTPCEMLSQIRKPLIVVCPGRDSFIHAAQRKAVLDAVPQQAEVWKVHGKSFLGVFSGNRSEWHDALVRFFAKKCFSGKGQA